MEPTNRRDGEISSFITSMLHRLPRPHFSPCVALAPSSISGLGLTAQRAIGAGEVLVVEQGPRVGKRIVNAISEFTGYECNTCVGWGEYLIHAPLHDEGHGAYLNHHCDPNAGMLADGIWVAIRPIATGTEITVDYGTFETMRGWSMECTCASKRCRHTVTAADFRLTDLQDRLGPWFAPYLKRQIRADSGIDLNQTVDAIERNARDDVTAMLTAWKTLGR
jgi:hypothetical protein